MVKKGATLLLVLAVTVLFGVVLASATADVAYIYRKAYKIDDNILKVFNESNITYELIDERNLPVNFANYKLIFVGDENFRYENRILVNQFPSVVANYYHTNFWGFTDAEGVSQLGADNPLDVKKGGQIIQVYTQGREYPGGPSVVYYYLDTEDKAPGFQTVAVTQTAVNVNLDGDVISYANPGTPLFGGKTQQAKLCFFGIIESDYWTPAAKELFKQCVGFVGAECTIDTDCQAPQFSPGFCSNGDLYRNVTRYTCQATGALKKCIPNQTIEFVENCPLDCQNSQCIGECERDSDCGASGPIDGLFCIGKNITQTFELFTCANASTSQSHCVAEISNKTNKTCEDACVNGTCQDIRCFTNSDCSDSNVSTLDTCHSPGTVQSFCTNEPIACSNNQDCGIDGFKGAPFCTGKNVTKLFESFTCHNPGTASSSCTSSQEQRTTQQCSDICINGACGSIRCSKDFDCNDLNSSTLDQCINPGTLSSECRNTPMNCASNSDCGFTGFLGQESCSGTNIVKTFQNATCSNSGTLQSFCTVTQQQKVLEHCDKICVNGQCLNTACASNLDCGDSNPLTYDQCVNPGTVISECRNTPINCASNIDCGSTGYVGNEYCSSDRNVSKNFQTADCVNPGQLHSYCDVSIEQQFLNRCDFACYNGACIRCDTNIDCNDSNPNTVDLCQNPGTISSYCTNEPATGGNITCRKNSDCGTNSSVGSRFCAAKDISQLFQTWNCNNPNTVQSFCSTNLITQIIQTCPEFCLDGSCVNIKCFKNSDCSDGKNSTADICHAPGTPQSFCTNEPTTGNITCSKDVDCGVDTSISPLFCSDTKISQLIKTWDCKNPGTVQSFCSSNVLIDLIQTCPEFCSDGECVDIECFTNKDCDDDNSQTVDICANPGTPESFCTNNPIEITCFEDSDCGLDGFVGNPFCFANNVTKLFQQFECNIPGTPQSYCSTSVSEITTEQCTNLCANGQCVPEQGECTPGQIRQCGTNVGECRAGINVCFTDSTWSTDCFGETSSSTEVCDNLDNDCDGQADEGGVCGGGCTNECSSGNKRCNGNGFQLCGNFDSDTCSEWSTLTSCLTTEICTEGTCVPGQPSCTNDCTLGSRECSGDGYRLCGNFDADSCSEWSLSTSCSAGQVCQSGQCVTQPPACTNDCTLGSRECSGDGYRLCGNFDADSCAEWSLSTSCSAGQTCQSGLCITPPLICQNDCTLGARRCNGNGYQLCGNFDADSCSEWSLATSCGSSKICSSGLCV